MLIPTHKVIAKILLNEISNSSGISLESKYFIYGNMLPDIVPKYIKTKHFVEQSLDFIIDKINNLLNTDTMTPRKFALELGIITHYLCDYYCNPHSDRLYFKGRLNEHMVYEKNLHSLFKQKHDLNQLTQSINSNHDDPIRKFIHIMLDNYNIDAKSYEKDVLFSLYVSSTIAGHIVENSKLYLDYCEFKKLQLV